MARAFCAGMACVDIVFEAGSALVPGRKHRARAVRTVPGGGALNAALAAAALGAEAALIAAVGRDAEADALRAALEAAGVESGRLVEAREAPTARSAVIVDPQGERTIVNHRDPRLQAAAPPPLEDARFDVALADTRWPEGAAALARAARARGRPVVLDAEAPVGLAAEAVAMATHLAFSEQGLAEFSGLADAEAGLRAVAARRPEAWLCVTRGPAPVLVLSGGVIEAVPAFPVEAVDTLGAGDVWHGVFAVSLGEGRAEVEAVRRANAAAALSAAAPGLSALPDAAALDAFLKETAP